MKKLTAITGMLLVMLLFTGWPCLAEDNDNLIYGCYQKKHGQLRVVGDHSECLPSEKPVILNTGPIDFKKYCWNTEWPGRPNYVIKAGVFNMGGGHYIAVLQPRQEDGNTVTYDVSSWGVVGDQIIMSVNETHTDVIDPSSGVDFSQCQFFLDSETLNGTGWCLETFYNPPGDFGHDYTTCTLTYIDCPSQDDD